MDSFGRTMIFVGFIMIVTGGLILLFGRAGIPIVRLPGDIRIQGQNVTCIIPIVTSILLSVVLTVVLNIIIRLLNK